MPRQKLKTNPIGILIFFCIFIITTHCYSIYILNQQNLTGLDISYDQKESVLLIKKPEKPSSRISSVPSEIKLFSLSNKNETVFLTRNLTIWPQESKSHRDLRAYLTEHSKVYKILQGNSIIANKGGSGEFELTTKQARGINHLPLEFWMVRLANTLALLICIFVWIQKPNTSESWHMITAGTSYYLFGLFYSILIGCEITLEPGTLIFIINLQIVFLNIFANSFLLLLTNYPRSILPKNSQKTLIAIFFLITLSNLQVLPDIPLHTYLLQFFILYIVALAVAYYQWRKNSRNPINKAAVIALQLSLLLPTWIIILLYFLPVAYNEPSIITHFSSHILLSFIFIGWTVGILKFQLFEVERWWFKSWLWIASTILIVCIDFILIYLFNWSKELTTVLTIILVGFIYFPIRQLIYSKTLKLNEPDLQGNLIQYFEKTSSSKSLVDYNYKWLELLKDIFNYFEYKEEEGHIHLERIDSNGLHLHVRTLHKNKRFILSGKQQGNRLFNKKDAKYCQILFETVFSVTQSNLANQEIRLQERKRVMHDLHDNLGAMLLTMTYNSESESESDKEQAKNALRLLRDTVYFSTNNGNTHCIDLLNRCRSELNERLRNKNITHYWKISIPDELTLTSEKSLAISYILRENFTNAIRHAEPSYINITFSLDRNTISIRIDNDNNHQKITWQPGIGMNSIKRRCKSISAECEWKNNKDGVIFELRMPLNN